MSDKPYNVLYLCTGNSARSIIAEALTNKLGHGRFRAWSAGSHPRGSVHPLALELLRSQHCDVSTLRSKDWQEFAAAEAPRMDFVFTVCDKAAGEVCPVWPGQPLVAHWGVPDPAAVEGEVAQKRAFSNVLLQLNNRIRLLLDLPLSKLDRQALQTRLSEIGHPSATTASPH